MNSSTRSLFPSVKLTADGIIKECIKQGYYRNPICNEVLYLHHKGYDTIDPSAFDRYVDVKVLWLEGNGFSSLACGGEYIQVKPPTVDKIIDSDEEEPESEGETEDKSEGAETTPSPKGTKHASSHEAATIRHADPNAATPERLLYPSAQLPLNNTVDPSKKDIFSSLYRTVRQLYLHNNVFREMPDLSRFQRLDSVNLSNNFFPSVRPCCPHWEARMAEHMREEEVAMETSKSSLRARQRAESSTQDDEGAAVCAEDDTIRAVSVISAENARLVRDAQLIKYTRLVDKFASFCEHEALKPEWCGKKWREVHPNQRCPCSSLRSLYLAGNHLETFEDLCGLLCYKGVTVLDLSGNQIKDGEMLLLILERMEGLTSLKLSGNPMVRSLRRYRKTVLSRCKNLMHLDDRPVFEEERRMVNAWGFGGDAAEDQERKLIKSEKEAKEKKRLEDFRKLIARSQRSTVRGGASGPHDGYIRSITTREAISAIEQEEAQSSATSSEEDDDEIEGQTSNACAGRVAGVIRNEGIIRPALTAEEVREDTVFFPS